MPSRPPDLQPRLGASRLWALLPGLGPCHWWGRPQARLWPQHWPHQGSDALPTLTVLSSAERSVLGTCPVSSFSFFLLAKPQFGSGSNALS